MAPIGADDVLCESLYKCCKKVQCKTVICIDCGQAFHSSCAERCKLKIIDNTRVKCCNQDITSNDDVNMENKLLRELVKEVQDKNALLLEKVANLEQKLIQNASEERGMSATKGGGITYAAMAATKGKPGFIIRPVNTKQTSEITKQEIKKKVDPSNIAAEVNGIHKTAKGAVTITCADVESRDKLLEESIKELGKDYRVQALELKKPKAIIVGVESQDCIEEDKFVDKLIKQNGISNNMKNGIIIRKKISNKRRNGAYNIIIELDSRIFKTLISQGFVKIGWNRCPVYEHFAVVRCFNCGIYGHFAKECKREPTCLKCSEKHTTGECTSNSVSCLNCGYANEKLGLKLETDHASTDLSCKCYLRRIEDAKRRTKYE